MADRPKLIADITGGKRELPAGYAGGMDKVPPFRIDPAAIRPVNIGYDGTYNTPQRRPYKKGLGL